VTVPKFDFRFTPESGLKTDIAPCPFGVATDIDDANQMDEAQPRL
jgi:hypothetical protein